MEIKIPKNETAMVCYKNSDGTPIFLLTTKGMREFYFLYSISENGVTARLGKSRSPAELEEKFNVIRHMY